MGEKETNPKDLVATKKPPLSVLPARVLWRVGLAMLEGALKYGRSNYRVSGCRASVYYDGGLRHLLQWWEGEDIDPDSGLNHLDKLLADIMVLRDSMLQGNWVDDRPPSGAVDMVELTKHVEGLHERYGDRVVKHYTIADTPTG